MCYAQARKHSNEWNDKLFSQAGHTYGFSLVYRCISHLRLLCSLDVLSYVECEFSCVHTHMSFEYTTLIKGFVTLVARVRTLSSVYTKMLFKIRWMLKCFVTCTTWVGTLSVMCSCNLQVTAVINKTFLTYLVWMFLCMHTHMSFKHTVLIKGFVTRVARVRTLSSVYTKMGFKIRWMLKCFVTCHAWVRTLSVMCSCNLQMTAVTNGTFLTYKMWMISGMHTHMSFKNTSLIKGFVTCAARVRTFSCMHKKMLFKVRWVLKCFFTCLTQVWTLSCMYSCTLRVTAFSTTFHTCMAWMTFSDMHTLLSFKTNNVTRRVLTDIVRVWIFFTAWKWMSFKLILITNYTLTNITRINNFVTTWRVGFTK